MGRVPTAEWQGLSSGRFARCPPGVCRRVSAWRLHCTPNCSERVGNSGIDRLCGRDVALRALGVALLPLRQAAAIERAVEFRACGSRLRRNPQSPRRDCRASDRRGRGCRACRDRPGASAATGRNRPAPPQAADDRARHAARIEHAGIARIGLDRTVVVLQRPRIFPRFVIHVRARIGVAVGCWD